VAQAKAGLSCPSAQPDMEGAKPFGVISGTARETRITFFKKDALAAFEWRESFSTADATRLFRFEARCEESRCGHFSDGACSLGHRVKAQLPAVVDALPPCLIRPTCRWHAEQGSAVCLRCPQVVTMIPGGDELLNQVATVR
jgi:hypothetical protein